MSNNNIKNILICQTSLLDYYYLFCQMTSWFFMLFWGERLFTQDTTWQVLISEVRVFLLSKDGIDSLTIFMNIHQLISDIK